MNIQHQWTKSWLSDPEQKERMKVDFSRHWSSLFLWRVIFQEIQQNIHHNNSHQCLYTKITKVVLLTHLSHKIDL